MLSIQPDQQQRLHAWVFSLALCFLAGTIWAWKIYQIYMTLYSPTENERIRFFNDYLNDPIPLLSVYVLTLVTLGQLISRRYCQALITVILICGTVILRSTF